MALRKDKINQSLASPSRRFYKVWVVKKLDKELLKWQTTSAEWAEMLEE